MQPKKTPKRNAVVALDALPVLGNEGSGFAVPLPAASLGLQGIVDGVVAA